MSHGGGGFHLARPLGRGITGNVAEVAEAGAGAHHECDGIGLLDAEFPAVGNDAAAVGDGLQSGGKLHAGFVPFRDPILLFAILMPLAGHEQSSAILAFGLVRVIRIHSGRERNAARRAGGETHDHDLVRMGNEILPREGGIAGFERNLGHAGAQIEFAAVILHRAGQRVVEAQVAERLIGCQKRRIAHEVGVGEVGRLPFPALEQQAADFRQVLRRTGFHVVVRIAGPEGGFVELDEFLGGIAVDHRAEMGIAQRQRPVPVARGLAEPEGLWVCGGLRAASHRQGQRHGREYELS